ncbi:hypothetical protein Goshw_002086 [Gossypium schwendimanii]|uniref:Uncharacterized protein n=1 Tax=Gossypium schwendimanii TaxID=34291 RepID=A0A7J9L0G4_GOSSC|nr:hypothetical protein [Gossypium schwendimanii]
MKMITCDGVTYDAVVITHKKYEPFLNKSIDHYDEMALVVGKYMAIGSFSKKTVDIDLDDGNQDLVPINCDNEEVEEVRTKVSSSDTSKCKRKNTQESVVDEQIKFVGFDDDFLCSVFDCLVSRGSEAKAFLAKSTKQRKFWLQKASQG